MKKSKLRNSRFLLECLEFVQKTYGLMELEKTMKAADTVYLWTQGLTPPQNLPTDRDEKPADVPTPVNPLETVVRYEPPLTVESEVREEDTWTNFVEFEGEFTERTVDRNAPHLQGIWRAMNRDYRKSVGFLEFLVKEWYRNEDALRKIALPVAVSEHIREELAEAQKKREEHEALVKALQEQAKRERERKKRRLKELKAGIDEED
jgi:non-ribosomal peptide synthetase component F